jgi:hypothetical protein
MCVLDGSECVVTQNRRPSNYVTPLLHDGGMFSEVSAVVASMDDLALRVRLRELEGAQRELQSEMAAVLAELDERKVYRADGHATMWGLLRADLHWSDRDCGEQMRIARLVARFPDAGESLSEQRTSVAGIAEIARAAANERIGDQIDTRIGGFLRNAELLEHDEVRIKVRSWERRADADYVRKQAESRHERRNAHWTATGDGGGLAVEWGPIDALANREILDHYLEAEWLADWEATVERWGDDASPMLMPRTAEQRRADAVTKALRDAASRPPGSKAPDSVIDVHIDHETFTDILIEAELFPERLRNPFEHPEPHESTRLCHTAHGEPLDPLTVFQLMVEGYIRYVIHDEQGIPITWGRKRRLFEGAARDAVRSLSTRCTHPGCRVPTKRTQTDHTVDWARGGRNDPHNGGAKCLRHNLLKNRGFTVHRDALGIWHTFRPDGSEIC